MPTRIKLAIRTLSKARGFTLAAVFVIALCIGANTAIFSIVNTVLWKPMRFADPGRLVTLTEKLPFLDAPWPFSAPDFLFVGQQAQSYSGVAAFVTSDRELSGVFRSARLNALRSTPSLFATLGIKPVLGRSFTPTEDEQSAQVAVLSDGLWRSTFGAARDILGRRIYLDRQAYTVIGVMPSRFTFPLRRSGGVIPSIPADLYIPLSLTKFEREGFGNMYNKQVIARLKPGVTVMRASAELNEILKRFTSHYPAEFLATFPMAKLSGAVQNYRSQVTGPIAKVLMILLAAIGLVLLIGCANVANLLLARSIERRREWAVRTALGASPGALIGQNLLESLILSITASAVGFTLACWLTPVLVSLAPAGTPRLDEVSVDSSALLFAVVLCCVTPFLFGLIPAWEASRIQIASALSESGRSNSQSARQRSIMRGGVIAEYALTLVLLVGAGLLMRSFLRLRQADPGFTAEHVMSMRVKLPANTYPKVEQILGFYSNVIGRLAHEPTVVAVGAISDLPLAPTDEDGFKIEGKPRTVLPSTYVSWVSGDAMTALGMRVVRGRLLTSKDTVNSPPVVVVNEAFARKVWPGEDAVGKGVALGIENGWQRVAGVVKDVRQGMSNVRTKPQMFQPQAQGNPGWIAETINGGMRGMTFVVRAAGDPASLTTQMRRAIAQQDGTLPITDVETLDEYVSDSVNPQRFNTFLLGAFAALALLLAVVGIGAVLWYTVAQRTKELGIRIALGSSRRMILSLVLKDGLRVAAIGIAIGIASAFAVSRLISSLLYETSTTDVRTFLIVPIVLAVTTLLISLIPAFRATRIDPVVALRME